MNASTPDIVHSTLLKDLFKGGGVTLLVGFTLMLAALVLPFLVIPAAICVAIGKCQLVAGCVVFLFTRPAARS